MKNIIKLGVVLSLVTLGGCAGFHETVAITKQSHVVNSIERDIKAEHAKQAALTGTVVAAQGKLAESHKEVKNLQAELEQEKLALQALVE